MSSPTVDAVSDPASVAALTAPPSPRTTTATRPSPTSWRETMVTLAALTIASAPASAATYPFVSIMPSASFMTRLLALCTTGACGLGHGWLGLPVERADDQGVDRWV